MSIYLTKTYLCKYQLLEFSFYLIAAFQHTKYSFFIQNSVNYFSSVIFVICYSFRLIYTKWYIVEWMFFFFTNDISVLFEIHGIFNCNHLHQCWSIFTEWCFMKWLIMQKTYFYGLTKNSDIFISLPYYKSVSIYLHRMKL